MVKHRSTILIIIRLLCKLLGYFVFAGNYFKPKLTSACSTLVEALKTLQVVTKPLRSSHQKDHRPPSILSHCEQSEATPMYHEHIICKALPAIIIVMARAKPVATPSNYATKPISTNKLHSALRGIASLRSSFAMTNNEQEIASGFAIAITFIV